MQPTSDERREVAKRLRSLAGGYVTLGALEIALGLDMSSPDVDIDRDAKNLNRLADLIDLPTCKLVELWDECAQMHIIDCTSCHFGNNAIEGMDAYMWTIARTMWLHDGYEDFKHCPICGAEVVE